MQNFEPLVSVIIPTYNRARFLPQAIQSVLDQTLQDLEIIVVDDGSTDNTKAILEDYKASVVCVHTEHRGVSHARNTGMRVARGQYIGFLDSDDTYLPYKLELQFAFLETHPDIGIVCSEASAFNEHGIFEENHLRSFHQIYNRKKWSYGDVFPHHGKMLGSSGGDSIEYYSGNIFRSILLGPLVISTTALFRREVLRKVGFQNETYGLGEDYEWMVRVSKQFCVGFVNYPTYLYRYHGDQISEVKQPWTRERALKWLEIEGVMLQAVLDWGIGDKAFYGKNKGYLNARVAELYQCIGARWLECGNMGEARACFRRGLSYDARSEMNRQYLFLSYLPFIARRIFFSLLQRMRVWDS